MSLSINKQLIVEAYEKGYRVVNGEVISPYSGRPRKLTNANKKGNYYEFTIRTGKRGTRTVEVHRLLAYQKFGEAYFKEGIQARHLDNNSLNNNEDNIALGTNVQNAQDRPEEERRAHAIHASKHIRKFTDVEVEEIRQYHNSSRSYKDTMVHFGISSKGTLHHILNNKYVT